MRRGMARTLTLRRAALLLALIGITPAAADPVADFYKGKTVSIVVGHQVGTGFDTYARVLARHMGRHIPGNPNMIVQGMIGASGITAANWLYNVAPKDGTVILATANAILLEPLYGNTAADFDTTKFEWIGSIGKQQQVCVTWHTSKAKTIADVQAAEYTVSATGATGGPAIWPRVLNQMIGTKLKVIGGYTTGASRLAVERGEVDGICGLAWSTLKTADPRWIKEKLINVLVQMGVTAQPDLKTVPLLYDMVKSPQDKKTLELIFVPDEMGRPFAMPPGTPPQHVSAVREAFKKVMTDPAFKAETEGRGLEVDPIYGEEMTQLLKDAFAFPKPIVARAAALIGRPGQKK